MTDETVFVPFRFKVSLYNDSIDRIVCGGSFSEVSGLEFTMAPKKIAEGGRNWGEIQRSGPTTFSAVVLKRGVTDNRDLHQWFDIVTRKANYGVRLNGQIEVFPPHGMEKPLFTWTLINVLPVKLKAPDLSATASQAAIEELHLVHEGLTLKPADGATP